MNEVDEEGGQRGTRRVATAESRGREEIRKWSKGKKKSYPAAGQIIGKTRVGRARRVAERRRQPRSGSKENDDEVEKKREWRGRKGRRGGATAIPDSRSTFPAELARIPAQEKPPARKQIQRGPCVARVAKLFFFSPRSSFAPR